MTLWVWSGVHDPVGCAKSLVKAMSLCLGAHPSGLCQECFGRHGRTKSVSAVMAGPRVFFDVMKSVVER